MDESQNSDELVRLRKANPTQKLVLGIISLVLGLISIPNKDSGFAVGLFILIATFAAWRYLVERKLLETAPRELVAQVKAEREAKSKARRSKSAVTVRYQAGFDELNLAGAYSLFAIDTGLVLEKRGRRIELPWTEVESVDAGTEDELRSRLTLTRVALIGIFALGAKKEKKQDFFVTITSKTGIGLFDLVAAGKNKQVLSIAKAFAVSCNSKIRAANTK